jgi:hypothetical protein
VGLKGMSVAVLIALAWPAQAADDVRCSGVWFHDGNRDRVGHCIYQIRYGRIPAHRSILWSARALRIPWPRHEASGR